MNIGMIIGRIGDVDGVALEAEKWIRVLERMGHQVFILSGRFKGHPVPPEREAHLPILSFFSPDCEWEQNRAFFYSPDDPDELLVTVALPSLTPTPTVYGFVCAPPLPRDGR